MAASFSKPEWLAAQALLARAVAAARAWMTRSRAALAVGGTERAAELFCELFHELFHMAVSNPRARDFAHYLVAMAALEVPAASPDQDPRLALHCDEGEIIVRPQWSFLHSLGFTEITWKQGYTRQLHFVELPGVGSAKYTGSNRDLATWIVPRFASSIDWLRDQEVGDVVWTIPFCEIDASPAHTLHACVEGHPLTYSLSRLGL
jgi:hypothetical protein